MRKLRLPEARACWQCRAAFTTTKRDVVFCRSACGDRYRYGRAFSTYFPLTGRQRCLAIARWSKLATSGKAVA